MWSVPSRRRLPSRASRRVFAPAPAKVRRGRPPVAGAAAGQLPVGGAVLGPQVGGVVRQRAALGGEEDLVALVALAHPAAEQFLAVATAAALAGPPFVAVRGVDERAAHLEVPVEDPGRIRFAGGVSHLHRAERELADLLAGAAEFDRLHAIDAISWSALQVKRRGTRGPIGSGVSRRDDHRGAGAAGGTVPGDRVARRGWHGP